MQGNLASAARGFELLTVQVKRSVGIVDGQLIDETR